MKIKDHSGDKKYFTIIPNYILNHSTLYDREVYIQMKRIAGENGTCWCSKPKLAKQCGISKRKLDSSIKYLLDKGWIKKIGMKKVNTLGGKQDVNEYEIIDLWDKNNDYYHNKGGASDNPPSVKGGARTKPKGVHEINKGGAPGAHKEEPLKKNHINNIAIKDCRNNINSLLDIFYTINPGINYANITQRKALEFLVGKVGFEKTKNTIKYAIDIQGKQYAPVISTPIQLKNKLGDLIIYNKKNNFKKGIPKI